MTTTLITGANKGLGRESARRLLEAGHDVWIGARDAERGRAAADELGARFVALDVTGDASVEAAAREVGELDVLVNNAGIASDDRGEEPPAADLQRSLATNTVGVLRVTRAFMPALKRSADPVVVNVSSGLGSLQLATEMGESPTPWVSLTYPVTKAALNMLTVHYRMVEPEVRFALVDPGFTATDLNDNQGHQTVQEGTDAIVAAAQGDIPAPFFNRGGPVPW